MRWALSLWKSNDLALAIDPTTLSDKLCVIVASVVYRGCAIPVAWVAMPGKWIDPTVEPLDRLSVAIPTSMRVIMMTDRGLRSPNLWEKINSLRWHPYMRQSINTTFRPENGTRMPARKPVSTPNCAFIARGTAFRAASKRLRGTIIVIWVEGQAQPWIALTDLDPSEAGGVVARAPLPHRNEIQGAQERGLATAENPSDRPREGGAPLAGFGGGDAADARRGQPRWRTLRR